MPKSFYRKGKSIGPRSQWASQSDQKRDQSKSILCIMSLQNYFYNLRGLQSYNMQDKLNGINKNDKLYNKREANAIYEVSCHKIYLEEAQT